MHTLLSMTMSFVLSLMSANTNAHAAADRCITEAATAVQCTAGINVTNLGEYCGRLIEARKAGNPRYQFEKIWACEDPIREAEGDETRGLANIGLKRMVAEPNKGSLAIEAVIDNLLKQKTMAASGSLSVPKTDHLRDPAASDAPGRIVASVLEVNASLEVLKRLTITGVVNACTGSPEEKAKFRTTAAPLAVAVIENGANRSIEGVGAVIEGIGAFGLGALPRGAIGHENLMSRPVSEELSRGIRNDALLNHSVEASAERAAKAPIQLTKVAPKGSIIRSHPSLPVKLGMDTKPNAQKAPIRLVNAVSPNAVARNAGALALSVDTAKLQMDDIQRNVRMKPESARDAQTLQFLIDVALAPSGNPVGEALRAQAVQSLQEIGRSGAKDSALRQFVSKKLSENVHSLRANNSTGSAESRVATQSGLEAIATAWGIPKAHVPFVASSNDVVQVKNGDNRAKVHARPFSAPLRPVAIAEPEIAKFEPKAKPENAPVSVRPEQTARIIPLPAKSIAPAFDAPGANQPQVENQPQVVNHTQIAAKPATRAAGNAVPQKISAVPAAAKAPAAAQAQTKAVARATAARPQSSAALKAETIPDEIVGPRPVPEPELYVPAALEPYNPGKQMVEPAAEMKPLDMPYVILKDPGFTNL